MEVGIKFHVAGEL